QKQSRSGQSPAATGGGETPEPVAGFAVADDAGPRPRLAHAMCEVGRRSFDGQQWWASTRSLTSCARCETMVKAARVRMAKDAGDIGELQQKGRSSARRPSSR